MSSLSNVSRAASGIGFLDMAAVVTLHKAAAIAERAHYKQDKEAHEVKVDFSVRVCKISLLRAHDRLKSLETRLNDLNPAPAIRLHRCLLNEKVSAESNDLGQQPPEGRGSKHHGMWNFVDREVVLIQVLIDI